MFLTARLFGICTYVFLLSLTCLSLKYTNNNKKLEIILFLYLCALVLMAFLFVPYISADLYRLAFISERYASMPFDTILQEILDNRTPGCVLYLYLVGKLNNYHFLPAIAVMIDFSLLFSILKSEIKRNLTKGSFVASALFLLMSSSIFMSSISGIRNMLAYSIIIWCVYREFILKKSFLIHLPLYLVAASFHTMGQVMLIYRIVFFLFEKNNLINRIFKILLSMFLVIIIVKYGQYFINGILEKANNYNESFQAGTEFFYIWGAISAGIQFIVTIYEINLFYKLKKYFKQQLRNFEVDNIIHFLLPLLIISFISLFFSYVAFARVQMFLFIFLLPTTLILIKNIPEFKQKKIQFKLFFISFVLLLISCTRGDLCSLKFWVSL